ncbi:MAG: hypothetical protein DMG00_14450 [Acidobacteria bacterium]|nr:MAG: hypothetical protein DMG00_14450 [Acidobacteriota bacterium]
MNRWCAQIGPGGRPSIGPKPPPSAGSTGFIVWFASAVGAGLRHDTRLSTVPVTGFRFSTSKRGIGCVNGWQPNVGLGGMPAGI